MTAKRLTFGYKGISFKTEVMKIRYVYKLEGYDREWNPTTHERRVDYRDVGPGIYKFQVRAIDKDLHYSDPPAEVTVRIYRPFYKRLEFFFLVGFFGMCLLGGVGYLIIQEKRQRKIAAEFRVKLSKQEEAERIQTAKMESLRRLVAGVAHEMNNPLGVITSSNDVSKRAIGVITRIFSQKYPDGMQEDEKLANTLDLLMGSNQSCQDASERIAKIVANIRRFVRLDEGEWQNADIHQCLDSVVDLLEPEIEGRITIEKEYGDIHEVYCSPSSLNQVFMAILRNATEAIKNTGEIRIRTYVKDREIKIEMSDSGIGIEHENIDKIFDPGYTTKGVKVGVGLGLSICFKVIVDEHKGHIDVSSVVGKGTTFLISLPLRMNENESQ
jgi:signal transduction histidine kinase